MWKDELTGDPRWGQNIIDKFNLKIFVLVMAFKSRFEVCFLCLSIINIVMKYLIKKISDVTYRIQDSLKSKPKVVHSDRLKPYLGENKPNWNINENLRNEPFEKDIASDRGTILLGESDLDAIDDVGISYSDSVFSENMESDVLSSGTNVRSKSDSRNASRIKDRANREKRPKRNVKVPHQYSDFQLY